MAREKPSISGTILGDADRGESVKCVGITTTKDEGEWMKAKASDGTEGFMKKEFLATTAPKGNGGGSSKPIATKGAISPRGICIMDIWDGKKVGQKKKDGKACSTLDNTLHRGFFTNEIQGEYLASCYEKWSLLWDCECQVKTEQIKTVPPGTACPPKTRPKL
jgi:hypothetical protein